VFRVGFRFVSIYLNRINLSIGKWTKGEEDQLMEIVQDMKTTLGIEEGDEIFWGRVSEKMGGRRGKQQCRNKWYDVVISC
jgi:hypothetical protein